jgi:hypothetical protein
MEPGNPPGTFAWDIVASAGPIPGKLKMIGRKLGGLQASRAVHPCLKPTELGPKERHSSIAVKNLVRLPLPGARHGLKSRDCGRFGKPNEFRRAEAEGFQKLARPLKTATGPGLAQKDRYR